MPDAPEDTSLADAAIAKMQQGASLDAASSNAPDPDADTSLADTAIAEMQKGASAAPVTGGPHPPHPHGAPATAHALSSAYKGASAPLTPQDKELSLGDALKQGASNFIPSAISGGKEMVNSVVHWQDTLKNLSQLGSGAMSQAAGAMGAQQDPQQKAKNEALITALENHYKQGYGSWAGFKKNVATDPFGVLMDASMVADPAAGALGKLADAGKLGAMGTKVAKTASTALKYVNPIESAVALAKAPAQIAGHVLTGASEITTGVPASALKMANAAGASSNPAVRAAFSRFAQGQGDASEFAQAAQTAMKSIRDDASQDYLARKGALADVSPSFDPIDDAIAKARERTMMGGANFGQFKQANDALDEADALVQKYKNSSDPIHQSLDGVDNLKQAIGDLANQLPNSSAAQTHLMGVYNGVKTALVNADPNYAELMERYQQGLRNTNDLTKTLGLGDKAAASSTLAKNLKALKTPTGGNLLQQLLDKDPTIGAMLAGNAVNPFFSHGRSFPEAMMGAVMPVLSGNPAGAILGVPGMLAASSPRLAGAIQYGAGAASRPINAAINAAKNPVVSKGSYYASRPGALQAQPAVAGQAQAAEAAPPAKPTSVSPAANQIADHIKQRETGGHSDPYSVVGPASTDGDHPYGAYQIMGKNIPEWTQEVLGHPMTPEEFVNNPDAQELVARTKIDQIHEETGSAADTASVWLSGKTLAHAGHRHDVLGTTPQEYAEDVTRGLPAGLLKGGRVGRASGGKVTPPRVHEMLVNRLMKLAKDAKTVSDKKTEPLLNAPDEHIVKALDVAQRAI